MKNILAYIDESGDPRFNEGASSHIYYSCVLIEKENEAEITEVLKRIKTALNLKEFKSSAIQTEARRISIIESLLGVDFKFLCLSIDKSLVRGEWKKNPRVFYKYTQKLLHKKLYSLYDEINITLDKFGSVDYQESFRKYLESEFQLELFDSSFQIGSAKDSDLVQLADLFGGTKRKSDLDEFERSAEIRNLLSRFNLFNFSWPNDFVNLIIDEITDEINKIIAQNSISAAERFIASNQHIAAELPKILTLEYLLFSIRHVNPIEFTYSNEIIDWLRENTFNFSEEEFRSQIIGQLRERHVIIIGSRKGLKIPVSMDELVNYLNFTTAKYLTMIKRTKITIDTIKASSLGKIDILSNESFILHKDIFELLEKNRII